MLGTFSYRMILNAHRNPVRPIVWPRKEKTKAQRKDLTCRARSWEGRGGQWGPALGIPSVENCIHLRAPAQKGQEHSSSVRRAGCSMLTGGGLLNLEKERSHRPKKYPEIQKGLPRGRSSCPQRGPKGEGFNGLSCAEVAGASSRCNKLPTVHVPE